MPGKSIVDLGIANRLAPGPGPLVCAFWSGRAEVSSNELLSVKNLPEVAFIVSTQRSLITGILPPLGTQNFWCIVQAFSSTVHKWPYNTSARLTSISTAWRRLRQVFGRHLYLLCLLVCVQQWYQTRRSQNSRDRWALALERVEADILDLSFFTYLL